MLLLLIGRKRPLNVIDDQNRYRGSFTFQPETNLLERIKNSRASIDLSVALDFELDIPCATQSRLVDNRRVDIIAQHRQVGTGFGELCHRRIGADEMEYLPARWLMGPRS